MKEMMKQTLKLLDEYNFNVQDIIIESQTNQKFITVVFNGESPLFKFECYDNDHKLIYKVDYTFRNSINISNLFGLSKICISIKDRHEKDYLFKKVLEYKNLE